MNSANSKIFGALAALLIAGLVTGWIVRVRMTQPSTEASSSQTEAHDMDKMSMGSTSKPTSTPMAKPVSILRNLGNPVCPVMENKVPAKDPAYLVYNGMMVLFCCPGCDIDFLEDPIGNLRKIQEMGVSIDPMVLSAAANPELVRANNKSCPVSGDVIKVGKTTPYVVHRGVRIDVHSKECVETFGSDPDGYLAKAAATGGVPADRLSPMGGQK